MVRAKCPRAPAIWEHEPPNDARGHGHEFGFPAPKSSGV
jgi:hypothetical protein